MTDNKTTTAISDPRSTSQSFSNRQDASFQYGDPSQIASKSLSKPTDDAKNLRDSINIYPDDPYNTDEADKSYLESKPTCFLIFGRPGVGKTTLARKLADDWHAELINIPDLITTNIKQKTELGVHARDLLSRGEAVPDQMVARMLDIKMRSPEVAHHGYILDGFPLMDEQCMKLPDQIETMKNWPLIPDYVINVRMPDEDLINRRENEKIDPISGLIYIKEQYAPTPVEKASGKAQKDDDGESDEGDDDEAEDDDDDEDTNEEEEPVDEFFTPVPNEIVDRLVFRPEDMTPDVAESIKHFRNQILRIFEDYMGTLPQSYLIEVDGNMSPSFLFEQLLTRLSAYPIRRAARVERFFPPEVEEEEEMMQNNQDMEDEEEDGEKAARAEEAPPADEIDTEELMVTLSTSNTLSNKYKWQRSRWLRLDPVALKQGNRVQGRQDLAVHFMDKIFVLSNKDSFKEFQKNPRRYLTQIRSPCKLFIYGPRFSGVEQLASDLAKKYNATVIDMASYAQPKVEELRQKYIEKIRQEIEQATIEQLQEQLNAAMAEKLAEAAKAREAEQRRKETESTSVEDEETTMEGNDGEEVEKATAVAGTAGETEASESVPTEGEEPTPRLIGAQSTVDLTLTAPPAEEEETSVEQTGPITADHPEVVKAVEKAVEEARNAAVTIPPDVYAELMHKAIQSVEFEQREKNPDGALFGNWIFVNFPVETEILSNLSEKNVQADDVIVVQDNSSQLEILQKRWYKTNRFEIDREIRERKDQEANEQRLRDDEEKRRVEQLKLQAEQERQERLAERQRKIEAGEAVDEEDEDAESEMAQAILDDQKYEPRKEDFIDKIPETIPEEDESISKEPEKEKTSSLDLTRAGESVTPISTDEEVLPPVGIEQQRFIDQTRAEISKINDLVKHVSGLFNIEPIFLDLVKEDGVVTKNNEEICQEAYEALEKPYKYLPLETENNEEEVEEEGADDENVEEEEEDDEEEGEEEQVDLFKRDRKKFLGDSSIYDAVSLLEKNILQPGKTDYLLNYAGKVYRFANEENRDGFLKAPLKYIPLNESPSLPSKRIIFLGPEGAGKTFHGRDLAAKCDLFHIKFRDRLQEMIIAKTKVKVGPEFNETRDEPDGEEEEKEEKPVDESEELTAEEENIKAYLQDGEPLANELLDKIIKSWWNEEPFRSRGFVLEGFPSNEDEAVYLVENQLLPDVIIQLDVEGQDVIKRILPSRMEQWSKKMQLRREKREKNKAKKDRDKKKAMDERRAELMAERKKRIEAGEAVDDDDVEHILATEFQLDEEEEEAIPEDEDPETAKGRISEIIEQQVNDCKEKLEAVKKILQEEFVSFHVINAADKPRYVKNRINKKLERFIGLRENLLHRVYPISPSLAQKLIDAGYLHFSKFGKFCPIALHNGNCYLPVYESDKSVKTAIYRKFVFYFTDDAARNEFMKNPTFFIRQPPPKSLIPAKIAIVGPPKSGKTTVAKRIVQEIGCVRLSLGDTIRYVLEKQRHTVLGKEIQSLLVKGEEIPAETAVRCLEINLMDAKCQTRGFILDNFPLTKKHVEIMSEKGIIPFKIFELECDLTECIRRAIKDRNDANRPYPAPDSPEAVSHRYAIYQSEINPVRKWYSEEHKNWIKISGKNNRWIIWEKVAEETTNVTKKIQTYLERKSMKKAASIADLCILPQELLNRLGEYEHFCPVSLVLRDELVDCSATTRTDNVAEYRGQYYRMAGPEELKIFLEDPERFAPVEPKKLPPAPNRRPHKLTAPEAKALFPKPVEFASYCPVTYLNGGKRYECLVLGQADFAVQYREKLYFMFTEEAQEKFVRQPEKYWNLPLPKKLPPPKSPIDLLNLPSLGYLEQSVATSIIKSLTSTGNFKPKYPFLSLRNSALIYLAYHLKAYNAKSSDYLRRKFRRKLYIFEEQCELISYLAQHTTIRYKPPERRTPDFNIKYETFFALKQNVPTLNWLS